MGENESLTGVLKFREHEPGMPRAARRESKANDMTPDKCETRRTRRYGD